MYVLHYVSGNRLKGHSVYVGNDTTIETMTLCGYFSGPGTDGQVITILCENQTTGHIVLLSRKGPAEYFHLAEVEVYALE